MAPVRDADRGPLILGRLEELRRAHPAVTLETTLDSTDAVHDSALVERVVCDLVERALADAPAGSRVQVTTRTVIDRGGAQGQWVEVLIQEPIQVDTHARARLAAPLLAGRVGVPLVDVSRTPGRGTSVRLLVQCADQPPAVGDSGSGPVVLLAEDDHAVRESLGEVLRSQGYRVLGAANGQAALEALDRHAGPIDLLLTDVMMPRMSGIELSRRLIARQPGVKVLFLSALPLPRGAVLPGPFVSKPLDLSVLLEQIPPLVAGIIGRSVPPIPPS